MKIDADEAQEMAEEVVLHMARTMTIAVKMAKHIDLCKHNYLLLADACWIAIENGVSFEEITETLRRGGYGDE